jgi:hypothetical protein
LVEDEDKAFFEVFEKSTIRELNVQNVKAQRHYKEYPPNKDNEDEQDGIN